MFKNYDVYIDDTKVKDKYDLLGKVVINIKGEMLVISEIIEDLVHGLKVRMADKESIYILSEKYFVNLRLESNKNYKISNLIKDRKIITLFHFTNIKNLHSILRYGLLTRDKLKFLKVEYHINDYDRFDNTNGISLSISFPNYKMFYQLRLKEPNEKWVLIAVNPSVLYELDCGFFYTNAANNSCFEDRTDRIYKTFDSLENVFSSEYPPDYSFGHTHFRNNLNINDSFPTNPQAEVLVFDDIPTSKFIGLVFNNENDLKYIGDLPKYLKVEVIPKLFDSRNDWQNWR